MTTLFLTLMIALSAQARDTRHKYSIEDALATTGARDKLTKEIKLFFGDAKHPAIDKDRGVYTSNKKTNAFNKTDKEACEWAFLSAMISLQSRAQKEGGNAVVGIKSYYKQNEFSSTEKYECGAGALLAGVTFKGRVVKLKEK